MAVLMGRRHQDPGAGAIHQQPYRSYQQGVIEFDGQWVEQAIDTLRRHQQGKTHQQHGAGEARETVDLAYPESKAAVAGQSARDHIGQYRYAQRRRMGGHVQPVRQQRHRAIDDTGDNLDHHHHRGDDDYQQGAGLPGPPGILLKYVVVAPLLQGILVLVVHPAHGFRPSVCV